MKIGEIWVSKIGRVEIIEIIYTDTEKDKDLECLGTVVEALERKGDEGWADRLASTVDFLYKDYFVKCVVCGDSKSRPLIFPRSIFMKLFVKER